jgi:hypothetical protein
VSTAAYIYFFPPNPYGHEEDARTLKEEKKAKEREE